MHKNNLTIVFLICFSYSSAIISCSPAYNKLIKQYETTRENNSPDYSDLYYWAAHPAKKDPADSISKALSNETRDTLVDVFFIHPTTYTGDTTDGLNADLHNARLNAKTDFRPIQIGRAHV